MAVKTERVTILTTADFKDYLSGEANKEGVSVSELIRVRCLVKPVATGDEQLLRSLVDQVNESTQRAKESLDKGLEDARNTLEVLKQARTA